MNHNSLSTRRRFPLENGVYFVYKDKPFVRFFVRINEQRHSLISQYFIKFAHYTTQKTK